ncbi:DapH/DapD/GlmU-related protein [Persicirhabdus sediminis]|uniref:Mannose-1-phosphate guanyltransferase C-terminal domain-containing protein n=1 Tax=Persicirhabdus sediminis TaxID=454144 RepID=A0A8J7SM34_9BACT|nr:hypothetical protein [Persicirhabdus sediminis]MBK1791800.1 hypothetical protein [Persicirhabdus sediminis]
MSIQLIPSNELTSWWPLNTVDKAGDYQIAGSTLHDLQLAMVPADVRLTQFDNAWISHSDWLALLESGQDAVLESADAEVLAWTGDSAERPVGALIVVASANSFRIRFPWQLIAVNEQIVVTLDRDVIEGEVHPQAVIEGHITLGKGSRILPGVFIEGNVVIGENCKIGPNCYLRGSTTIGDNCHIGQAVEIKNSLIGNKTAVGHLSYIGDSVLGHGVNLGAGTITSNLRHDGKNHRSIVDENLIDTGRRKFGAIIGDGTHTGIHTAIYPGRKLAANTTTRPNETVQKDIQ